MAGDTCTCINCKKTKPSSHFISKTSSGGTCKQCEACRQKTRVKNNSYRYRSRTGQIQRIKCDHCKLFKAISYYRNRANGKVKVTICSACQDLGELPTSNCGAPPAINTRSKRQRDDNPSSSTAPALEKQKQSDAAQKSYDIEILSDSDENDPLFFDKGKRIAMSIRNDGNFGEVMTTSASSSNDASVLEEAAKKGRLHASRVHAAPTASHTLRPQPELRRLLRTESVPQTVEGFAFLCGMTMNTAKDLWAVFGPEDAQWMTDCASTFRTHCQIVAPLEAPFPAIPAHLHTWIDKLVKENSEDAVTAQELCDFVDSQVRLLSDWHVLYGLDITGFSAQVNMRLKGITKRLLPLK